MDNELKKEWITALRSGQYMQGRYCLRGHVYRKDPSYCCLGVLCDVFDKGNRGGLWEEGDTDDAYRFGDDVSSIGLPIPMRELVGIDREDEIHLIKMNDNNCQTFGHIANWIEDNL